MYDTYICNKKYKELKQQLADIFNADIRQYDFDRLSTKIYEMYEDNEISATQYDDLMSYVQELEY